MTNFLFIIDFFDNVILQRPKRLKAAFRGELPRIKSACLRICKDASSRYIDEIETGKGKRTLLAKTDKDNFIVGVLLSEDGTQRARVWKMLDEILGLLEGLEDKEEGIKDIKPEIDRIHQKYSKPSKSAQINTKLLKQASKVEQLVEQQKETVKTLEGLEIDVSELEYTTKKQKEDSQELHWRAYLYNKKLELFILGAVLLLCLFIATMFYKVIK